jgi:hypothetical protein
VLLSYIILNETDSLGMPVVIALAFVSVGIFIVDYKKKD